MLGGSLNEGQIPTGYQPGYFSHLLIDLNFFQRTGFGIVIVVLQIFKEPVFGM